MVHIIEAPMYTGIVQALLPVQTLNAKPGLTSFCIAFPESLRQELELGASVAVNGLCLTVAKMDGASIWFDVIRESLAISNLSGLCEGHVVNVERSARANAEVGGHILSGHVRDVATVVAVEDSENNRKVVFRGDLDWLKYVFLKGFLALNGASLTVAELDRDAGTLAVNLIPETLKRTTFGAVQAGDEINVEIDAQTQVIVETVERVLAERGEEGAHA
jgi:riboflavin synthase